MSQPEPVSPSSQENLPPAIARGVVFFYYDDLSGAVRWYRRVLAPQCLVELEWVVIVRIGPGDFFLGLVDSKHGTLKAGEDKRAMLSVETPALEPWLERIRTLEPGAIAQEIGSGGHGLIEQFVVRDPGGYLVEFFRWKAPTCSGTQI